MLCSGDKNYGSHSSLGIEGYKDATVFVRMRTHLLREPSIHYRVGLGDWKKWCSGGVMEVQGNTAICEKEKIHIIKHDEYFNFGGYSQIFYKLHGRKIGACTKTSQHSRQQAEENRRSRQQQKSTTKLPEGWSLLPSDNPTDEAVTSNYLPWTEKNQERLMISFSTLIIQKTVKTIFTDSAGHSCKKVNTFKQKCQIP